MNPLNPSLLDLLACSDPKTYHEQQLRASLKEELLGLSFHGYEETVKELLTRLGYADARLLGRTQWRQYTRHGGGDMEAFARVGVTGGRIILQIKQYQRVVSRRFVDELAGVLVRSGAQEGIIITTSRFSKVAQTAAKANPIAPIRLIDGEELIDLLFKHRLGVWSEQREGDVWYEIDSAFFADLRRRFPLSCLSGASIRKQDKEDNSLTPDANLSTVESRRNRTPMLWRTHVLAAISSLWLLDVAPRALTRADIPLAVVMVSLGSLLPDLDAVDSKIRHMGAFGITPFAPVSSLLHRTFGHRGIVHSPITLVPVAVLSVGLTYWIGTVPGISLLLGYGSHLAMDAMTKSGIPLIPFSKVRFHLLPAPLRIVTGSVQEDILMVLLALAALVLLLHFLVLV